MNVSRLVGEPVRLLKQTTLILCVAACLSGCGGKILKETEAKPASRPTAKINKAISTWLGNPARNFFGTGPWTDGPLVKVWEVETKWTTGPLHEDPWSGTSWPGQPAVDEHHVYFGAAGQLLVLSRYQRRKRRTGLEVSGPGWIGKVSQGTKRFLGESDCGQW